MSGLSHNETEHSTAAGDILSSSSRNTESSISKGSKRSEFESNLDKAASDLEHNHEKPAGAGNFSTHASLKDVDVVKRFNTNQLAKEFVLFENLGARGDFLDPKGGKNTVIGSGDDDVINLAGGGLNTVTTGAGKDTIILGQETTNRIFDFQVGLDRLVLGEGLKNIVVAQGKNPTKAGVDQPLDSVNNTLIIDKDTDHILASITFTNAKNFNEATFSKIQSGALESIENHRFDNRFEGSGKVTGTRGSDKMIGGNGNDFLYVGDDGFKFETARGGGGTEFPFRTDSPGTSALNAELKNGVLQVNGSYQDFDGFPLFSQGEKEIDPKAKILNGSDPVSLINGFLKVPKDVEGNPISGTHLHFSPSGDSRGDFADATVIRYFQNTPNDAKSGTITGKFELTSEEQAALLAGNLYVNLHTNIDGDGDGRAGFPTGENRINFNQDVVKFV